LVICLMDCPSGRVAELEDQILRFGQEIIPQAKNVAAKGGWRTSL